MKTTFQILFQKYAFVAVTALLVTSAKPAFAQSDDDGFDTKLNASITQVAKALDGKDGKVAVMDFPSLEGKINGLSSYIANRGTNQMINAGKQVVDRSALEKVIRELKLQQSALMDPKTAAKVGRLAGAKYFLMGNFTRLPRAMNVTIRLLNVQTAQFVSAQEASIPMNGDNTELINSLMQMAGTEVPTTNLDAGSATASSTDSTDSSAKPATKNSSSKSVPATTGDN